MSELRAMTIVTTHELRWQIQNEHHDRSVFCELDRCIGRSKETKEPTEENNEGE